MKATTKKTKIRNGLYNIKSDNYLIEIEKMGRSYWIWSIAIWAEDTHHFSGTAHSKESAKKDAMDAYFTHRMGDNYERKLQEIYDSL